MEVSRLSFTKKTKEAMQKGMSVREKGRVMFSRLEELDKDGTLSKAKSRADVARLVGYSEERAKAGYSWVSNLIDRGHLTETIREWTPSGKMVAEYHLTDTRPDYGYEEVNRRRAKKEEVSSEWVKPIPMQEAEEKKSTSIKIEITRGDTTIKVEMGDHEEASKLITTIMKGE